MKEDPNQPFFETVYINRLSRRNKLGRLAWGIVQSTLFRWSPRRCFAWRRFLLKCFGAKLAKTSLIFPDVSIWAPWNLTMLHNAVMGEKVYCYNVGQVTFEADTSAAGFNTLCTAGHNIDSEERELTIEPIRLCRGSWLFFNSFIYPGVTLGEGAIVAAGTVVVKDVDPYSVVGGNPAKLIKWRGIKHRSH